MSGPEVTASIGYLLVQAARAHRGCVAAQLEPLGLHVGQELLLAQLCGTDGLRQSDLARRLGVELPTVNKALRRLESAGFVERRADPDDARASCAYLTAAGGDRCERIHAAWDDVEQRLLSGLSAGEIELLRDLLKRLSRDLSG